MHRVLRLLALALMLTLVMSGAGGAMARAAGQSTPGSGTPGSGTPTAGSGPAIGTPVAIVDETSGDPLATITVTSVTDPFKGYSAYGKPDRGYRWVAVEVSVTNASETDPFPSPSYTLAISCPDGLVVAVGSVDLANGSDVTPLSTDDVAPKDTISGTVFFMVPTDEEIGSVVYADSTHFTLLGTESGVTMPKIGDDVKIVDSTGADYGTATVSRFDDPFTGNDPRSKPNRGYRYVAATVEITNTSGGDLDINAGQIFIQTSEGLLYTATGLSLASDSKVTPLNGDTVADGKTLSGTVFFEVPEGVDVTGVLFQADSSTMLNIGDPSA